MNDRHSSVITLQEVALKAHEFANFLEDFGFQNPEAVTTEVQALHAKAFKLWWKTLNIKTLPE